MIQRAYQSPNTNQIVSLLGHLSFWMCLAKKKKVFEYSVSWESARQEYDQIKSTFLQVRCTWRYFTVWSTFENPCTPPIIKQVFNLKYFFIRSRHQSPITFNLHYGHKIRTSKSLVIDNQPWYHPLKSKYALNLCLYMFINSHMNISLVWCTKESLWVAIWRYYQFSLFYVSQTTHFAKIGHDS